MLHIRAKALAPLVAAVAVVSVLALPAAGSAATPEAELSPPSPDASGWIRYELPPGVNAALTTQHVIQGQHEEEGGCRFTYTGSMSPGSAGVEENEVALNPSTCQAVYSAGPIQQPEAESGMEASSAAGEGGPTQLTSGPSALLSPSAADPTKAFYLRTWYEDPAGIDVTSLRNDLEWSYSGGCVNAYKWKRNANWYAPSGWGLNAAGDKPYYMCANAGSNSEAQMENNIFCAFTNTWTHYDYNHKVWGTPDGMAHYEWNDSWSGACSGLLTHNHAEGFEEPW